MMKALRKTDGGDVVVLVDEAITFDKRVATVIAHYGAERVTVIDCSRAALAAVRPGLRAWLELLGSAPWVLGRGLALWRDLGRLHNLRAGKQLQGLRASFDNVLRARQFARDLAGRLRGAGTIHANDLVCGVVGAGLAGATGATLVYDSHEIQFHRNRKNGWWRAAFDSFVEKQVIERADRVLVVNGAIADLYCEVYGLPARRVQVVYNNHFAVAPARSSLEPADSDRIGLVYVGGGIKGRQLELLAAGARAAGVPVHAFFIGARPAPEITRDWRVGGADYRDALDTLAGQTRCAMWCCVDDVCLSYRLSLPNKFFQAMAVGMPVVAAAGSYLAEVVREHGIGYVFDGHNIDAIARQMRGTDFAATLAALERLRQAVAAGTVRI